MQGCRFEFLSVALIASLFGWLYNTCVLVPWKRESELKATLISAALNAALNLVLIPYFKGERAAALYDAAGRAVFHGDASTTRKGWWSSCSVGRSSGRWRWDAGILAVCTVVKALPLPLLATIFTAVLGSVAVYGVILIALKKPAGAGVSGQIQAEDQTQDLNFSAKLLPPSLT